MFCPCLRSWSISWMLSPFPSFRLWNGSRNSGGGPVLLSTSWWTFQSATETGLLRRASDSVHRQSDGHSVEDSETERRHHVTSPKLFHQMFLHTQGNLSQRSGHMDPSLVSEIARRLRQHRGHHNVAKKEKEGTVPQPTQHRLCATLWQHGKHFQLFVRD